MGQRGLRMRSGRIPTYQLRPVGHGYAADSLHTVPWTMVTFHPP